MKDTVLVGRDLGSPFDALVGHDDAQRGRLCIHRSLVITLFWLLLLAQVQAGLAIAGRIWQAFPSWDNPSTHAFEDGACLTPPYSDPTQQACGHALPPARPLGRLLPSEEPGALHRPAVSCQLTRSPPGT